MGLIGSIKYLSNRFSGRKSSQDDGKPAHKNGDKKNPENAPHYPEGTRLGQKLDTTA
ncbi:MAG: hypothetical protein Q7T38_03405 [Gallionella sp.]|nr:hypothetical protein [Gallionella sp.]